ncbi:hypothetical protein SAMN04487910_3511 [Aquimarina amphilecti]|uniref:LexA-binding, inner membrane-associated hydrolase n=1 Tax=Aquimarina amphilecti TaxID=1038014 RepID=A0A1H7TMT0_AQUAM|nr:DUF6122 family protein [Aquimarina amphilecti]SEL85993.1 hypothetical protein SAMN04487910_3511 [Aquimarina amphilecti]
MLRTVIHYGLHFIIPLGIAFILFPKQWKKVYLVFLGAMFIDLDHLLANPIFDPNRCSIGFHFLHSVPAIIMYLIMLIPKNTRVIGLALLWHIITDYIDCLMI